MVTKCRHESRQDGCLMCIKFIESLVFAGKSPEYAIQITKELDAAYFKEFGKLTETDGN